ncbi:lipoate--protein ligase [Tepidibacter mesophilus]|uniref:lipoate--protein ligase n=1 Tax=Tepidibacter mesophilus TaxID=655607 RepID=UPI000C06C185|nr:lipoate--protein ligase [Tepidibacter mesophilus]
MHNNMITRIVCSKSYNPWHNLAIEEYLLKIVKDNEMILYLWQNDNTIVIGRNQNPWKECKCKDFEEDGGKIARRLSGGGTVFHDMGNLNFTFIMDKKLYDLEKQLSVILKAVNNLGINAEFSGRNDILVGERKFSGNAFYEKANSSYHHGSILVDANMEKLSKYLKVSKEKIASKGVESVRSRVVNLKTIKEDITIENLKDNLISSFMEIYKGGSNIEYIKNEHDIKDLYEKYSSWEWKYGETPKFDINFVNRFKWGEIDLNLNLKNGDIDSVVIYSDAMNSTLIKDIENSLLKTQFKMDCISKKLNNIICKTDEKNIIFEIKEWLKSKIG